MIVAILFCTINGLIDAKGMYQSITRMSKEEKTVFKF